MGYLRIEVFFCVLACLCVCIEARYLRIRRQHSKELSEYCAMETFNASCPHGSVIMMQQARYGRMRVGRCLSTNYLVGCYANVLPYADAKCSGHHKCEISVLDPQLVKFQPCRKDLMAYLEASYTCVPVPKWSHRECENNGLVPVPSSDGHVQFRMGHSIPAGTASCPYHIKARKGQKLKFDAYNFQSLREICQDIMQIESPPCEHQLVFQDGDKTTEVDLCAGRPREQTIYTSTTSAVSVYLKLNHSSPETQRHGKPNNILMSHQAIGCADLGEIPNADVIRRNDDTALVKCRGSHETFNMICTNHMWIGNIRNCSKLQSDGPVIGEEKKDLDFVPTHAPNKIGKADSKVFKFNFKHGSSIVIAVACGLLFGLLIGAVFLICFRNFRKRKTSRPSTPVLDLDNPASTSQRSTCRAGNIYNYIYDV